MNYIKKIKLIVLFLLIMVIIVPTNSFATANWTERQPAGDVSKNWITVASDSDGSNLIVAAQPGRLYTSSDSGASWTERQPAGDADLNWSPIASDSDGTNLIAGVYQGRLYTSSDSGASWTERQPGGNVNMQWTTAASDADGSNLIVAVQNGRLYTSSNGGTSWTERQPAGNSDQGWLAVTSDDDGTNLAAVVWGGRFYTSSDSGASWTERQPEGNADRNWYSVASDSDGSNLIVGGAAGRLYTSSDSGANWTERQPAGEDFTKNWNLVASDDDGSVLIAGGDNNRIYFSTDSGATWGEEQPAGDTVKSWYSGDLDSDGTNLVAAVLGGRLYTGLYIADSTAPSVSTLSPTDNATGVALNANLVITFDENVDAETGNIVIYKASDDSVFETIAVGDTTGTGTDTITINPTGTFTAETAYYVQIAATAFDDAAGNSYAGIADKTTWNFTTGDFTNPSISSLTPADNATDISLSSNLVLTFSEAVDAETGNIVLKTEDGTTVETIDVTSGLVTGSGTDTITINPTNDLDYDTSYYVTIDATAFDDTAGNSYAGISDATTWNFETSPQPRSSSGSAARRPTVTVTPTNNTPSVPSAEVCKPGDLFSVTTGKPCAPVIPGTITTPGTTNTPSDTTCKLTATLKEGARGEQVKCLQSLLNIPSDGIFGPQTKAAVISFQMSKGLDADGIVGPKTRAALGM